MREAREANAQPGLRFQAGRLAYRLAQRVMTLDVTRLLVMDLEQVRKHHVDPAYAFRFLSPEDVIDHSYDDANELDPGFATRIVAGHDVCYAGLHGDQLASYIWLGIGSIEAEHNRGAAPRSGVALSFGDDTAFVYKGFTRPEHRGRRLYPACLGGALRELSPIGVRRLLATADWSNVSALRGCTNAGFIDLGGIWRFGFGPMMFTVAPAAGRRAGVRFGSEARVASRQVHAPAASPSPPPPHATRIVHGRSRRSIFLRSLFR